MPERKEILKTETAESIVRELVPEEDIKKGISEGTIEQRTIRDKVLDHETGRVVDAIVGTEFVRKKK